MPEAIVNIQTGARLHFGPLSFRPRTGRHFGGVGLMIDAPGVRLRVESLPSSRSDEIPFPRVAEIVRGIRDKENTRFPSVRVDVLDEIPPHQGFGSGTQLALALAESLRVLSGNRGESVAELAQSASRGARSAIGIHGYLQGGFLVDAGHRATTTLGDLACRLDFPAAWRVLLVSVPESVGMHGPGEQEVFSRLPSTTPELQGELARLTLTELLPAVRSADFPAFAAALAAYGEHVGEFFSDVQGGIYSSQVTRLLAGDLKREGLLGIVQSSWGPTIAVFCESDDQARSVREFCRTHPLGSRCHLSITRARNTGRTLAIDHPLFSRNRG